VVNPSTAGPQNVTVLGWVRVDPAALNETSNPALLVGTTPRGGVQPGRFHQLRAVRRAGR
jgi:hypothetical protein